MICGAVSAAFCKKSFAQAPTFQDDHGTFVIALNGERVGTERFEIHARDAQVEARAETSLTVNGNRFETSSTFTLNAGLNPLTYRWNQTAPQRSSLQIDFGSGGVHARYNTVRGRRDTRQFDLPSDSIILDDNAVYQYEIAIMRYNRTSGGTQTFHALIPQEGLPGMITLASAGTEAIAIGNKQESCRHLILTTNMARVDLWVDPAEHLQKMEIAASGLIAMREH